MKKQHIAFFCSDVIEIIVGAVGLLIFIGSVWLIMFLAAAFMEGGFAP